VCVCVRAYVCVCAYVVDGGSIHRVECFVSCAWDSQIGEVTAILGQEHYACVDTYTSSA
jgi:hypothetical protein